MTSCKISGRQRNKRWDGNKQGSLYFGPFKVTLTRESGLNFTVAEYHYVVRCGAASETRSHANDSVRMHLHSGALSQISMLTCSQ